ncbi:hypothetical protein QBC35DRAFT_121859 [Podospora australis]|uniref:Ecp2 effector protein-like domain-containing protein n=1 Tax=Podospora australis TaxID=1536484 RepID=A0AAN6WX24_9PEZI|nr:hypothetical protein QBC35DRAFT_121859 [Podospora australis]
MFVHLAKILYVALPAFILPLLLATVTASPVLPEPLPPRKATFKLCTPPFNLTAEFPDNQNPLTADCRTLIKNISGGATWKFVTGGRWAIATFATCAFKIEAQDIKDGIVLKIGDEDVVGAINAAFDKFPNDGVHAVATFGTMGCPESSYGLGPVRCKFWVSHTNVKDEPGAEGAVKDQ